MLEIGPGQLKAKLVCHSRQAEEIGGEGESPPVTWGLTAFAVGFLLPVGLPPPVVVIGQKVNIAARMMMYYPGIVSCDSVTYDGSNLPAYFFKELPKKVMKGVADPGPVYQCLGLNEKV